MSRRARFPATAVAAVLWITMPAGSAETVLEVDLEASSIVFELGATLHTVHGTASLKSGTVRFDPDTGAVSGALLVETRSLNTANEKRDRKMHANVLESVRFPLIRFVPVRLEGAVARSGTSKVSLHGRFEIHGEGHDIVVPLEVAVEGDRLHAAGTFRVPYVQWGLKDPSAFLLRVKKHVDVTLKIEGRLSVPAKN